LIANTDRFVFFDIPQYVTRSWMNRNRIINPNKDFTYVTVQVKKAPQKTPINEIYLSEPEKWADQLLAQLTIYKKRAPYYQNVIDLVKRVSSVPYEKLVDLNVSTTKAVCEYLEIPFKSSVFSEMNLKIGEVSEPDEWALEITKAMGYDTYINPPGGMSFFNREKYAKNGITLEFLQSELTPYVQRIGRFEPGLSILDVMMFNSKEEIREMLGKYTIL